MSSIDEVQASFGERLDPQEFLHFADRVMLGDASTSSPNVRGCEIVLAVKMARQFAEMPKKPEIITTLYSARSIEGAIKNTPYNFVMRSDNPEIQRRLEELGIVAVENSFLLTTEDTENGARFAALFGNPQARLDNILLKGLAKAQENGDPDLFLAAVERAGKFLGALPATLFLNINGQTFPEVIVQDRLAMIAEMGESLYPDEEKTGVELYESKEFLQRVALRDIAAAYPEQVSTLGRVSALTCTCPECSLSSTKPNGDGTTEESHAVNFKGEIFKNSGALTSGAKPFNNCNFIKKLTEYLSANQITLLDAPLGALIDCGFKLSGKLIYLAEALVYQDPMVLNAIRDYSDPRGTVKMSMDVWAGLGILTPRIYIHALDNEGKVRDATGYETMAYMRNGGFQHLKDFADSIPVASDGRVYKLNISTNEIEIN